MREAYYSSVLPQSVGEAWSMIRDFNNYPRYIEGVTESVVEDHKRGDEVWCHAPACRAPSPVSAE